MFAVTPLIPFLAVTSALASGRSPNAQGSGPQAVLDSEHKAAVYYDGDPNAFEWVNAIHYKLSECPPDLPCGVENDTHFICAPRVDAKCPKRVGPLYSDVRVLVGCESLPVTAPLCPRNKCEPDCLCRETLLWHLQSLLLENLDNGPKVDEH